MQANFIFSAVYTVESVSVILTQPYFIIILYYKTRVVIKVVKTIATNKITNQQEQKISMFTNNLDKN